MLILIEGKRTRGDETRGNASGLGGDHSRVGRNDEADATTMVVVAPALKKTTAAVSSCTGNHKLVEGFLIASGGTRRDMVSVARGSLE